MMSSAVVIAMAVVYLELRFYFITKSWVAGSSNFFDKGTLFSSVLVRVYLLENA